MNLFTQWWVLVELGWRAHLSCWRRTADERALCHPRMHHGVLSPGDAAAIVEATEAAASAIGGFTSSRHMDYPTTDLPIASIVESAGELAHAAALAIERASNATTRSLVERCGATAPALKDGFVIKYSSRGQAGLDQHGDACRYSATVALTPPRHRGVSVPAYASLPPQTCERRRSGDATETCVDPRAYPERLFAREPFKWEFPLLEYAEFGLCRGQKCDDLSVNERHGCECAAWKLGPPRDGDAFFDGGGTRFSSLRDVTFYPDVGDAVVHGARLKHGGVDVTNGTRYVLAFFFEEELCMLSQDNRNAYDVLYGTLIFVFLVAPACAWIFFADFGG
mmetsp:Transcript_9289/g.28997  ORF Transcript_9289/g.28997 Transcript_9289/m.28997 type:complete len:337 (-) Transcript_9289:36-1046(-)